jgi:fibronectin-binding autotransporter adhesin
MKLKQLVSFASALLVSLSSLFIIQVPKAFAATITWDGGGANDNMTTAENWVGDVAPSAGDDLVFPTDVANRTVVNDFAAGTSFDSITFSGTATMVSNYDISGNEMEVVSGISSVMTGAFSTGHFIDVPITLTASQAISTTSFGGSETYMVFDDINIGANTITFDIGKSVIVSGIVSGSGTIVKDNAGTLTLGGANTFSGSISVNAGLLSGSHANAFGTTAGATTVNDGAEVSITTCDNSITIDEDFSLTGQSSLPAGDFPTPKLHTAAKTGCSGAAGPDEFYGFSANDGTVALSGDITLGGDITFASGSATTTLSGGLSGSFKINLINGYSGKLVINSSPNTSGLSNGTYQPGIFKKTLSDDQSASSVGITGNTEITITGKRGDTFVSNGGVLKGSGTVGELNVNDGGKVAPGLSPGCLNTGNLTFVSGSAYDFELGGATECTEYDRISVTGTVDLGNGTLNTLLINDFKPTVGNIFTIISNDGADAVTGTFDGLAQGATFTISGYVLAVSYTGGDGNDVVLTVQSVPAAPNTGFRLVTSNPLVTFTITVVVGLAIAVAARRLQRVNAK